jgi:hypothetical protein
VRINRSSTIELPASTTPWIFGAVAIVLAVLDVWLIFWAPNAHAYKFLIVVPVVTFFLLVVIFAILSMFMSRKLLEEMKTSRPMGTQEEAVANAMVLLPVPPLAVEVLTNDRLPTLSPAAGELVARGRQIFYESVIIHRRLTWYLIVTNCTIALVALGFGESSPLPTKFTMFLLGAVPLLRVVANPQKSQNTLTYLGWALLHTLWAGLSLFVAGVYIVALAESVYRGQFHFAAVVPPILIGVALFVHVHLLTGAIDRLRREVLSHPPLKLLFLWVFGPFERINSLFVGLGALWRCLGTLQLLQGGAMIGIGSDVFRYLRGRTRQIIALTPEQVEAKISTFQQAPHRWMCMYSTNMLLCSDQSWRYAVTTLLRDTDLVLMDLCGFSRSNAGCTYEIGQLIDNIDICRFLLLVDETTDLDFLHAALKTAWEGMASHSPNRQPDCGSIQLFRLEGEYVEDKVSLAAAEKNAACVMQLLCAGVTRVRK